MNSINPTLNRLHTAHVRGKHGVVDYENSFQKGQPKYWTLPKRTPLEQTLQKPSFSEQNRANNYLRGTSTADMHILADQRGINNNTDSVKISPIDPRNTGPFKSSTPTNKESTIDINSKLLSPVKSTMTNDELYAVIHKSKKKLNIKETPERSESPALSTLSLSPVAPETSLYSKGTQRYPETGYLGDPRSRWSLTDRQLVPSATPNSQKPESTTCADRFGPIPQTSRLDFKKLLLQHSVKLNTLHPQNKSNKLSAVEQLKLSKEKTHLPMSPPGNRSQINILDLSGSPKTYNHRKIMKSNNQPTSPGRTGALIKEHKSTPKILLSPKSQWRFSSPRSDVLSSPIPEANNEDENSNSSGEKQDTSPVKTVPIVTNQHFGARRSLIPISERTPEVESDFPKSIDHAIFPLGTDQKKTQGLTRSEILQAKRAEFFSTSPDSSPPKFTSFKSPTSAGPSGTEIPVRNETSPERGKTSPTTLETAL